MTFFLPSRWRLWLHRRFFFERHFWVKRAHRDIPSEQWCFECGTVKGHVYPCRVENAQRMMMCDPSGDYLNCLEVLEAFLFVGFPAAETYTVCAWCEDQVRRPL